MNLTAEEIKTLEACRTNQEWRRACEAIKAVRGCEYPTDWGIWAFRKGNLGRITSRWGSPGLQAVPCKGNPFKGV